MSQEQERLQLTRRERERQFKRREIVNAARSVFAKQGFTNATLEEIAEKAEFGKGTLYNYFSSKDELFETVLADAFDEIMDIATQTCDDGVGMQEGYTAFARRLLTHLFTHIPMHALIAREFQKMDKSSHLATMLPNLILVLSVPLERDIAAGRVRSMPSLKVASLFFTMILTLFRCTLQARSGDISYEHISTISLDHDEILSLVGENLEVLNTVFFLGVLGRRRDRHDRESE